MTENPYKDAPARHPIEKVVPLAHLKPGTRARVTGTRRGHSQIHRLASLGLTPGSELVMITGAPHGPVIVEVRGARYIIGRGMAQNILVEPAGAPAVQP